MEHWTQLVLIIVAITLIVTAMRMNSTYENGSFLAQGCMVLFGAALGVVTVAWFLVGGILRL